MSEKSNKTSKRHRSNINSIIENDTKTQKLEPDSMDSMDYEIFTPNSNSILLQSHQQNLILA